MRDKTVGDAMTPLESVFMLDINECIGHATMDKVHSYQTVTISHLHLKKRATSHKAMGDNVLDIVFNRPLFHSREIVFI